jgi:hypothetical protein
MSNLSTSEEIVLEAALNVLNSVTLRKNPYGDGPVLTDFEKQSLINQEMIMVILTKLFGYEPGGIYRKRENNGR